MPQYTNVSNVPLSMAVFLATDSYDYVDEPNYLSATSLIKPLRQLILASRVKEEETSTDLTNMVASRMGTAIHDGIEKAWKENYKQALKILGYPDRVIEKIVINPRKEELTEDSIPIYLEQRAFKKVQPVPDGKIWTIGGKFDFVGEGRVEDFKSTSTYTAINHSKDDDYTLQGSIYRWLNPEIITRDEMAIQFIFTDWSAAKARTDPNYPQSRVQQRILKLKSIAETDAFIRRKLRQIEQFWDADEIHIPECSDEDLWRSEPVFKYYKNRLKMTRSTKNFETKQEAYQRLAEDNHVGVVVEQPGQVTACRYCAGFALCSQKDQLIASGDLTINV
jgi:hypothetical protein